jgi:hypothetical protein
MHDFSWWAWLSLINHTTNNLIYQTTTNPIDRNTTNSIDRSQHDDFSWWAWLSLIGFILPCMTSTDEPDWARSITSRTTWFIKPQRIRSINHNTMNLIDQSQHDDFSWWARLSLIDHIPNNPIYQTMTNPIDHNTMNLIDQSQHDDFSRWAWLSLIRFILPCMSSANEPDWAWSIASRRIRFIKTRWILSITTQRIRLITTQRIRSITTRRMRSITTRRIRSIVTWRIRSIVTRQIWLIDRSIDRDSRSDRLQIFANQKSLTSGIMHLIHSSGNIDQPPAQLCDSRKLKP